MRLLLRQLVLSAPIAGEAAKVADRILVPNLDAARVVNAFAVIAHTRLLTTDSTHKRILPLEKELGRAVGMAVFILKPIDNRWPMACNRGIGVLVECPVSSLHLFWRLVIQLQRNFRPLDGPFAPEGKMRWSVISGTPHLEELDD
jgi:hypothetical protein